MYKASIVNYYNTTPFLFGLNNSAIKNDLQIELDVPSVCAQKIKNNKVQIGLVPVAILPELSSYHIFTEYCIGAKGKVDSVKLFSEKPLDQLTHILLDHQSKTSIALVQILNKYFWKKKLQFVNAPAGFEEQISDTIGAVIIGDRTFGLTKYPYQIDLAEEWTMYTNLPFVFAVWVSNILLPPDFIEKFNQALSLGVKSIDEAILQNPKNIDGFDAVDYLKNKISYDLSQEKKTGMNYFLELLKKNH
ncbi:MAG: menaquinone biosynthetic enzyme MqnA/MqnD family protein [Bacteroidota bacterium]